MSNKTAILAYFQYFFNYLQLRFTIAKGAKDIFSSSVFAKDIKTIFLFVFLLKMFLFLVIM